MDLPRLVELLADRLNPVLPYGMHVEADGDKIEVFGHDGGYGKSGRIADDPTVVAEGVLSAVQDDIAHGTRGTAWPEEGRDIALPWARIEGDVLLSGYGEGIVTLEPIPLADFMLTRPT